MSSLHAKIFISYIREDTSGYAGSLSRELIRRFGPDDVFIDLGSIVGGEDFEGSIRLAVARCHVLLVIISPQWVLRMKKTKRRFWAKNKKNWIVLEIETAFRSGVHILPVLVHGAQMPNAWELPNSLSALSQRHGMEISELNWETDVFKVIKRIEELFDLPKGVPHQQPEVPHQQTKESKVLLATPQQRTGPPVPLGRVIFDSIVSLYRAAVFLAVVIIGIVLWNYPQKARGIFESVQSIFGSPKPTPSPYLPKPTPLPFQFPRRATPTASPSPIEKNLGPPERRSQ